MVPLHVFIVLSFCVANSEVVILSTENYEQTQNGAWFIDFYAPWCGHCRRLAPIWEGLALRVAGQVHIAKVDCTVNEELRLRYNIMSFPTLKLFHNNQIIDYNNRRSILDFITFLTEAGVYRKDFEVGQQQPPQQLPVIVTPEIPPQQIQQIETPSIILPDTPTMIVTEQVPPPPPPPQQQQQRIVLRYFQERGEVEPVRLYLEELGFEYQMISFSTDEWLKVRDHGIRAGLFPFGSLPSLSVDTLHLVSPLAILRHLSKLRPNPPETEGPNHEMWCDIVWSAFADLHHKYLTLINDFDFQNKKFGYVQQLPNTLTFFENFLTQTANRLSTVAITSDDILGLFISKRITYVDMYGWDVLSLHIGLEPTILDNFPSLKHFFISISQRSKIQFYLCSNRRPQHPHNSAAFFGNEAYPADSRSNPIICLGGLPLLSS